MAETAKDYSNSKVNSDLSEAANDGNYSLEKRLSGNGIISFSDVHGNYGAMKRGFDYARENNLVVALNGDIINDYNFMQAANDAGYKPYEQHFIEYASQNFGEKDLQTYFISRNVKEHGFDAMLGQVPEEYRDEAKKNLEGILKYSDSEIFEKKKENLERGFEHDVAPKAMQDQVKLQLFYNVFMDEEAQRFASFLNENSDVQVAYNLGNHENAYFVEMVKQYLENPDQILDLTNSQGYTYIDQENGQSLSLVGMTNCAQKMPYLNQIFSPEQEIQLNYHMGIDQIKYDTLMQGDVTADQIDSLEEKIKQDYDYQRMQAGNDEVNPDILMTHGNIGVPMMNGKKGYEVPFFGVAAYMANNAKLTLEGHIHGNYEGQYSFGSEMARVAGENALVVRKGETGELEKSWVSIYDGQFDGNHHNPIPYDTTYLRDRVEILYEQLIEQAEKGYDISSSESSAKAA